MLVPTLFLSLGIVFIFTVSMVRWRRSKKRMKGLNLSAYTVFSNKSIYISAKLIFSESLAIPITTTLFMNDKKMHLLPSKFSPFLFMTDYPYTFFRADLEAIKFQRAEFNEIVFTCRKTNPSFLKSVFEITIKEYDPNEKNRIIEQLKSWS